MSSVRELYDTAVGYVGDYKAVSFWLIVVLLVLVIVK